MTAWGYPGNQGRRRWHRHYTPSRWSQPEWKSLAWAVQLLTALDLFFVVMIPLSSISVAVWWCALFTSGIVLILVSVLAVRR